MEEQDWGYARGFAEGKSIRNLYLRRAWDARDGDAIVIVFSDNSELWLRLSTKLRAWTIGARGE